MGIMNPVSPNGHSAWDYAQAILNEIAELKQEVRNSATKSENPQFRRIPFTIAIAGQVGSVAIPIPEGFTWQPLIIQYSDGVGGFDVHVNDNTSAMTRIARLTQGATNGDVVQEIMSNMFHPDLRTLPTDQSLILTVPGGGTNGQQSGNICILQYRSPDNTVRDTE